MAPSIMSATTWAPLVTTVAGGLGLMAAALVLRVKKPEWTGSRAVIMLVGSIAAVPVTAQIMSAILANSNPAGPNGLTGTGWIQELLRWFASILKPVPAVGPPLSIGFDALATALAWIVAVILIVWFVVDMFPRVWTLRHSLRRHRGGDMERGGRELRALPAGTGGGGRFAALHEARPATMWIAALLPAGVALVPPLAAALKLG